MFEKPKQFVAPSPSFEEKVHLDDIHDEVVESEIENVNSEISAETREGKRADLARAVAAVQEQLLKNAEKQDQNGAPTEKLYVYDNQEALKLLTGNSASAGLSENDQKFRVHLFDTIRQSGTSPLRGELAKDYFQRANEIVKNSSLISHPAVIELPNHTVVAVGGDLNARSLLANEYAFRLNPSIPHVYVDAGNGEYFDLNSKTIEAGQVRVSKMNLDLSAGKTVF